MDNQFFQEELKRAEKWVEKLGLTNIEDSGSFFIHSIIFPAFSEKYFDIREHYDGRDEGEQNKRESRKNTVATVDSFNLKNIEDLFSTEKTLKVLDVGCAEGDRTSKFIQKLEQKGYAIEAYGIDYSEIKCQKAKKQLGKYKIFKGDMRNLPFGENSFDILLQLYAPIGHLSLEDMPKAVSEFYRVLKKRGAFCMDVLGRDIGVLIDGEIQTSGYALSRMEKSTIKNRNYLVYKREKESIGIVYVYSEQEVKDLIKNSGFILKNFKGINGRDINEINPEYMTFSVKE